MERCTLFAITLNPLCVSFHVLSHAKGEQPPGAWEQWRFCLRTWSKSRLQFSSSRIFPLWWMWWFWKVSTWKTIQAVSVSSGSPASSQIDKSTMIYFCNNLLSMSHSFLEHTKQEARKKNKLWSVPHKTKMEFYSPSAVDRESEYWSPWSIANAQFKVNP